MLYDVYKVKVYNIALSYLKNVEDAEEITQDVFLTIFNKASTFKKKSKVSTWVYRITVNKSLNQLEKRKRKPTSGDEIKDFHAINFSHPGVQLANKEKAKYLFAAIEKLEQNQQTAFIMSYIEGIRRDEVAHVMGKSLKSIEGLLQRAKANLKKELVKMYPKEI